MTRQGPVLPSGKWKLTAEGYRRLLDGWDRELRTKLAGDPAAPAICSPPRSGSRWNTSRNIFHGSTFTARYTRKRTIRLSRAPPWHVVDDLIYARIC